MRKSIFLILTGICSLYYSSCTLSCESVNSQKKVDKNYKRNNSSLESVQGGYKQLVDRNKDSICDEVHLYNFEDEIILSTYDENFDGYMETVIVYVRQNIHRVYIDSNANGYDDIVQIYESGVLKHAERYYSASGEKNARLGKVKFFFSYPIDSEQIEETNLSEKEFHKSKGNPTQRIK
ncbi:hypothetical protein [Aliikangiella sp. IMCC44632]